MDATFGVVPRGWAFYNILVVDGEGESVIVACFYYGITYFKVFPQYLIICLNSMTLSSVVFSLQIKIVVSEVFSESFFSIQH